MEQRFFDRLRDRGVILPGAQGGYYLDPPAWDAFQTSQRSRVKYLLVGLAILMLGGVALLLGLPR